MGANIAVPSIYKEVHGQACLSPLSMSKMPLANAQVIAKGIIIPIPFFSCLLATHIVFQYRTQSSSSYQSPHQEQGVHDHDDSQRSFNTIKRNIPMNKYFFDTNYFQLLMGLRSFQKLEFYNPISTSGFDRISSLSFQE